MCVCVEGGGGLYTPLSLLRDRCAIGNEGSSDGVQYVRQFFGQTFVADSLLPTVVLDLCEEEKEGRGGVGGRGRGRRGGGGGGGENWTFVLAHRRLQYFGCFCGYCCKSLWATSLWRAGAGAAGGGA